jgi:hypothetical protein
MENTTNHPKLEQPIKKGVRISNPSTITVGEEVSVEGDRLLFAGSALKKQHPLYPGPYHAVKSITTDNINYIALRRSYRDVPSLFFGPDPMEACLYEGALEKIDMVIAERIKRLQEVADRMPQFIEIYRRVMKDRALERQQQLRRKFFEHWSSIEELLKPSPAKQGNPEKRGNFLDIIRKDIDKKGKDYRGVVQGLDKRDTAIGTKWLQGIVDEINSETFRLIPSFYAKGSS